MRLKVDISLVSGGDRLILAAKNATKTIPIVMAAVGHQIGSVNEGGAMT